MQASQEPANERDDVVGEDEANEEMAFMTQTRDVDEPEEPKKKRYYRPNEVMKKKGCIGCGGMGLIAVLGALTLALVAII